MAIIKKTMRNLKPGDHFIFKDKEWVCLDPDYAEGKEKGVFAIAAQLEPEMPFAKEDSKHNPADYTYSIIRSYLKDKFDELLKDVTITHKCDLRTDNGDEQYPPVYDNVFILSIFEYFQYIDYVPRYDDWHRLRSAHGGTSSATWLVNPSGYVGGSSALIALACAPACIIRKSNNLRPTPRSQKKQAPVKDDEFEIYVGRTEKQNRRKAYIVSTIPFGVNEYDLIVGYEEIMKFAKRYFRQSEGHIEVACGWVLNDELYLEDPKKKGAKRRAIAFYV